MLAVALGLRFHLLDAEFVLALTLGIALADLLALDGIATCAGLLTLLRFARFALLAACALLRKPALAGLALFLLATLAAVQLFTLTGELQLQFDLLLLELADGLVALLLEAHLRFFTLTRTAELVLLPLALQALFVLAALALGALTLVLQAVLVCAALRLRRLRGHALLLGEDGGEGRHEHLALLVLRLERTLRSRRLVAHGALGEGLNALRGVRGEVDALLRATLLLFTEAVALHFEAVFEGLRAGLDDLQHPVHDVRHVLAAVAALRRLDDHLRRTAVPVVLVASEPSASVHAHLPLFLFGFPQLTDRGVVLADHRRDFLPEFLSADVDGAHAELRAALSATRHGREELPHEVLLCRRRVDGAEARRNAVLPLPDTKLNAGRELAGLCIEAGGRRAPDGVLRVLSEHLGPTTAAAVASADLGTGSEGRYVRVVEVIGAFFAFNLFFGLACIEVIVLSGVELLHRSHVDGIGRGVE